MHRPKLAFRQPGICVLRHPGGCRLSRDARVLPGRP